MRKKNGLLHILPKQTPLAWCNEIRYVIFHKEFQNTLINTCIG